MRIRGPCGGPQQRRQLSELSDPSESCSTLIDDANQAGGHDNISVIVAMFDGAGLEPPDDEDVASLKYDKYTLPTSLVRSSRLGSSSVDDVDTYDDTPSIEILGEFQMHPDMDWDDVLGDRVSIPTEPGPSVSNVVIWLALLAILIVCYLLVTR